MPPLIVLDVYIKHDVWVQRRSRSAHKQRETGPCTCAAPLWKLAAGLSFKHKATKTVSDPSSMPSPQPTPT